MLKLIAETLPYLIPIAREYLTGFVAGMCAGVLFLAGISLLLLFLLDLHKREPARED